MTNDEIIEAAALLREWVNFTGCDDWCESMLVTGAECTCGTVSRIDRTLALLPLFDQAREAKGDAGWRPIETAPRDGRYILAIVAPNDTRHLSHLEGRVFSIRHEGKTSGYDLGWAVYPGYGGAPDDMFSHWRPLPAPPAEGEVE